MARRQMRDLVLTSEILTLPDMTGYMVIPGDYPIAKVKYGYMPTEKQAEGFVERDGFAISFKPLTPAASAAQVMAAQDTKAQAVPAEPDLLDDDDMGAPSTIEVSRNANGDVIDKKTGEIIKAAAPVSHAKDELAVKAGSDGKKVNPLADAL